jgi:FkbM family methyltransferase
MADRETILETRVRFKVLKDVVAGILVNETTGMLIGRVLRERIPCRGCAIDTSQPAVSGVVKAMLLLRMYESAEQRFVARYMRTDLDVVELGSSLGVVTSQIARRLQRGRRIVAVEANEALLPIIRANVKRNAPQVAVELVHGAIDHSGASEVELVLGPHSFAGHVGHVGSEHPGAPSRRVQALTLRKVLADHGLGDYVLVSDIEGAEAGIIAEEHDALARCRQLLCELHDARRGDRVYSAADLSRLLRSSHGFRLRDHYGNVCVFER